MPDGSARARDLAAERFQRGGLDLRETAAPRSDGSTLRAGLGDEISIHLVPVLFVAPTRLFDDVSDQHVEFESTEAVRTATATHLGFRMMK